MPRASNLIFLGAILAALIWILRALDSTATILILAFGLAYMLQPLVNRLQKRGLRKNFSIPLICILLVIIVLGVVGSFIPLLISQVRDFVAAAPEMASNLIDRIQNLFDQWQVGIELRSSEFIAHIKSQALNHLQDLAAPTFKATVNRGWAIILWIMNILLFPIFLLYLLFDFDTITAFFENLTPPPYREKASKLRHSVHDVLSSFIRGQVIVCLFLATIYGLGLWLVGLPFGLLVGTICGLLSFIPYLGFGSGLITASIILLVNQSSIGLWISCGLVFGIGQSLETYFLTPRLIGGRLGLSPLATILSVILGAQLMGFMGMIVSIPLAAILKRIASECLAEYRASFEI